MEVAEAGLFQNRPYVLTPEAGFSHPFEPAFRKWLNAFGARVISWMPPNTTGWSPLLRICRNCSRRPLQPLSNRHLTRCFPSSTARAF